MDVDLIQKGRNFTEVLDEHLDSCGVMLVLFGNTWITARSDDERNNGDPPTQRGGDFASHKILGIVQSTATVMGTREVGFGLLRYALSRFGRYAATVTASR